MSALGLLFGLVLLGTLLWLLRPLWQPVTALEDEQDALNLALYQRRQTELAAALQAGTLAQEQYAQAQAELEQEFARYLHATPQTYPHQGRWLAGLLLLGLPALGITLYQALGNPQALMPAAGVQAPAEAVASPEATPASDTTAALQPMLAKLAQRLHEQPTDGKGWLMLGRTYAAMERHAEASLAFARAQQLLGDDPDLLFHYAEALGSLQDGRLTGLAGELVLRAIALQPDNPRGLFMAGLATYQTERFAEALTYWQQLAVLVKDDPQASPIAAQYVAQAQAALLTAAPSAAVQTPAGVEPASVAVAPASVTVATMPAPVPTPVLAVEAAPPVVPEALTQISVQVSLAPELQARVPPETTVFVFARAATGPRMPLAIQRLRAGDLPATVTLDDTMSMSPQVKLSQFSPVLVGARVSFSGNAVAQPGDLEGFSAPLTGPQPGGVTLTIQQPVP